MKGRSAASFVRILSGCEAAEGRARSELLQILGGKAANIRHATQIYSYLLRPTTAITISPTW